MNSNFQELVKFYNIKSEPFAICFEADKETSEKVIACITVDSDYWLSFSRHKLPSGKFEVTIGYKGKIDICSFLELNSVRNVLKTHLNER